MTTIPLTTPEIFQIFECTGINGTINMALLPSSVNELELPYSGTVTIINAPAAFTVDLQSAEATINAANTVAITNELTIVLSKISYTGRLIATGYGTVDIVSQRSI